MCMNRQEQFTPLTDVNLLNCLLSYTKFGGFEMGEQEQKAQVSKKYERENDALFKWLINE